MVFFPFSLVKGKKGMETWQLLLLILGILLLIFMLFFYKQIATSLGDMFESILGIF